ncbi:MAG TPA: hypothetical protein ENN65_05570 [Candidatus Hydrogenedentes bacterium]|nr:hypothetical protein [Candidatus Hydrogenedentota bacterium]
MAQPFGKAISGETKKKGGACVIGCLGCCVLLVVLIATPIVGGYLFAKHLVESYTDTKPVVFPEPGLTAEETESLLARVLEFKAAIDEGRRQELSLSGDELNAALRAYPDAASIAQHVYFRLEGDRIRGEISFPMEMFKLPFMQGRYLNGSGEFQISLKDGMLDVRLLSLAVRDIPLPEPAMAQLAEENLAKDIIQDPEIQALLRKIESLEVRDGRLILVSREKNTESVVAGAELPAAPDYCGVA